MMNTKQPVLMDPNVHFEGYDVQAYFYIYVYIL